MNNKFDYRQADSQGTYVEPVKPEKFDMEAYEEYEEELLNENKKFWDAKQGVAVYRRFRVPQVFSHGCKDMELSLALQLAALKESMKFKCDIANFLEPWYGIGTVASSFGLQYVWLENQAPAINPAFKSIQEALDTKITPVEETDIGKHTLNMIEYFLDKTKGRLPVSFTDTQSPLNIAASLFDISTLFLEIYDNPEDYRKLLSIISNLLVEFTEKQHEYIGDALASPGHGFSSSRRFTGIGMSDDNMLMISNEMYEDYEIESREIIGARFGGVAFHSCGDWSKKIPAVFKINNIVMADGAFSPETDPNPNDAEPFAGSFKGTGIVLNARIVGDVDTVVKTVKKLWTPGMKLIVCTYCKTPEEQEEAYNRIHEICV